MYTYICDSPPKMNEKLLQKTHAVQYVYFRVQTCPRLSVIYFYVRRFLSITNIEQPLGEPRFEFVVLETVGYRSC